MAQAVGTASMDELHKTTFLRLMEDYSAALARLAGAYLPHPEDREDLLQEIATAIWTAIPRFKGEASERTWLYRIAHNTAITVAAKVRRRGQVETAFERVGEPAGAGPGGDERLIRQQQQAWLTTAIRELPLVDRQVLILHLEGLRYSEIHEVTGLGESAIGVRLTRIRERLGYAMRRKENEL
ncbi:RNA polymerase sigma factor [Paludibaculum fermentans]|uniref:RNA polymerase sigma factor n=1 Tax=Paludibaculum fermentans TaxID=1473598 RepID=UPI003EBDE902